MNTTIVLLLFLAGAGVPTTTDCDEADNQPQWAEDDNCQREKRIKLIENGTDDLTVEGLITKGDLEILQGNLIAQAALIQALQDSLTAQAALISDQTMLIQTFQDVIDFYMLSAEDAFVTKGDLATLKDNMTTTGTQLTNLQNKAQKSAICGASSKSESSLTQISRLIWPYDVTGFGTATTSEMNYWTGIYTVGTTGVYAITVSGNTLVDHENTIRVFLWYNDDIEHDQMIRTYTNGIQIRETQSTTRFKKLYEGDRVGVTFKLEGLPQYLRDISAFNNVEFCVELYQAL